nr:immunoglobulin light chain junction region [Macaca mulatta]
DYCCAIWHSSAYALF